MPYARWIFASSFAQEIAQNLPPDIVVFELRADEARNRTPEGHACDLMFNFV